MFNLEAILTANGVGAVLMIILLISSRMHTRSIFLDEKIFVLMVWLTLSLCVTEAASFAIDGRMFPGSRLLKSPAERDPLYGQPGIFIYLDGVCGL